MASTGHRAISTRGSGRKKGGNGTREQTTLGKAGQGDKRGQQRKRETTRVQILGREEGEGTAWPQKEKEESAESTQGGGENKEHRTKRSPSTSAKKEKEITAGEKHVKGGKGTSPEKDRRGRRQTSSRRMGKEGRKR